VPYTPRELELLAEASLLAVQQIRAEQAPMPTSVGSKAPIVSGIPQKRLRGPASPARVTVPVSSAIVQQVVRLGSALNPASSGSEISPGEKPDSSEPSTSTPIPVPVSPPGSGSTSTSGGGTGSGSGAGSSSGWGSAGKVRNESGRTGSSRSWGSTSEGAP
jgi:hypothetical protein